MIHTVDTFTIKNSINGKKAIITQKTTPTKFVYDYYVMTLATTSIFGQFEYIVDHGKQFSTMKKAEAFAKTYIHD